MLLVAFAGGAAIRAWRLDGQIRIDDEWHAIHKLAFNVVTTFLAAWLPMTAAPGPVWPDVTRSLPEVEARLGPAVFRDEQIVVFQLPGLSSLGNTGRTVQQ